jgi:peptidoglycan LD-endopeptidase LytH
MLFVITGLLVACGPVQAAEAPNRVVPPPATQAPPTSSPTPTSPPPAPTETSTDTPTASPSPTETNTPLPSDTATIYRYVFPVQPSRVADFVDGTASHGYPATDIFAPRGAKFVAVTDGVVDFVSFTDNWDPDKPDMSVAGGLAVAILGDDGVRYYGSHLEAIADGIAPGVRVTAGQLLGLVGNTGNARDREVHVHFGISRPTTPDDWKTRRGQVDPMTYLVAWRAGINLTPPLPAP